jgi:hypothetical protein
MLLSKFFLYFESLFESLWPFARSFISQKLTLLVKSVAVPYHKPHKNSLYALLRVTLKNECAIFNKKLPDNNDFERKIDKLRFRYFLREFLANLKLSLLN